MCRLAGRASRCGFGDSARGAEGAAAPPLVTCRADGSPKPGAFCQGAPPVAMVNDVLPARAAKQHQLVGHHEPRGEDAGAPPGGCGAGSACASRRSHYGVALSTSSKWGRKTGCGAPHSPCWCSRRRAFWGAARLAFRRSIPARWHSQQRGESRSGSLPCANRLGTIAAHRRCQGFPAPGAGHGIDQR